MWILNQFSDANQTKTSILPSKLKIKASQLVRWKLYSNFSSKKKENPPYRNSRILLVPNLYTCY